MEANSIKISPQQLLAIENAMDGIAVLDANGKYTYMNQSHAHLFGYDDPEELVGKSWKTIYTEENAKKIEKDFFPILMEKGSWLGETIGLSKQGKPVLQYISLTKLPDNGLICVCRDHSRSIEASRLEYLMGNLGKSVLVEDENHGIVMINQQFCDLFQIPLSPKDMIGLNCLEQLKNSISLFKDPDLAYISVQEKWNKKDVVIGEEIHLVDGSILERDYIPVIIDGEFRGQLWSYTDVTQNRKMQQSIVDARNRAIASEKAKSAFLSNISHEIRTPMNAIIGLAEQLSMEIPGEKHRLWASHIRDAADGLLGIINDVLDISKIEAGKMKIENDIIDLRLIYQSVTNILKLKAEEKGLSLVSSIDDAIEQKLIGDDVRIRQIFVNIIGNAIKFTDKGQVKIDIELMENLDDRQLIKIVCLDTGIGISKEAIESVFDDFFQEYNSSNSRSGGTGLGLSITKTLLSMMGGDISIKSNKGGGTEVKMYIPLKKVLNEKKKEKIVKQYDVSVLSGKHILIVEDNKMNRFVLKMMLENFGVVVNEAENGLEAIEMLCQHKYDLILMDIQMPVMDGTTALSIIREKYGEQIPVIALTASAFKSEVDQMLEKGFDDCITKPIDQKMLSERLVTFFGSSSNKSKYYASLKKSVKENILAMAGNQQEKVQQLLGYLAEEIKHALSEWEVAVANHNWEQAKKVLHREKAMLNSIGLHAVNPLINQIEDESRERSDAEYQAFFDQLIELFKDLRENLFS